MKKAFTVYYREEDGELDHIELTDEFLTHPPVLRADVLLDAINDLIEVYNKSLKEDFHAKVSRKESSGKGRENSGEDGPSERAARP